MGEIWEWIYTIFIAVAIALLIKCFLFDIVKVDGSSMYPTLIDNDRLIITKLGYTPKQGDIIILDSTYKNRSAYFDKLAQANGKEELNSFEKLIRYPALPKEYKHRYYVKRIIALPGQTLDIRDGKVYVDGEQLSEEYYDGTTSIIDPTVKYPVTVDDNCVFVMGDNRNHSKDSRDSSLGQVPYDAVVGKSQIRIFPFNHIGKTE
ncbi:MAG: signal peptidase I [Clostridia bacterium]|nr:signal peptidase I [Clostridia bacterium]